MIQLDPVKHREWRHYHFDNNGFLWIRTSIAAKFLNINHVTLNRDCRLAYNEGIGNLANLTEYIQRDGRNEWWIRSDLDEVYTMLAPGRAGQGENKSWFYVKDLQTGERPCY